MAESPPDIMAQEVPKAPKKHGLFGKEEKVPTPDTMPEMAIAGPDITEVLRRLRILEERYANIRTKTNVIEQNMISRHKQVQAEIKASSSDIHEIKIKINEIMDRMMLLVKEFKTAARKEDVKVLEKYVQLWEPVKFVTRNEVEDVVKRIIQR